MKQKGPLSLLGSPSSEKLKVDAHLSNTIGLESHVDASRHAGVYESYLDTWSRLQRSTVTRLGSVVPIPALASNSGTCVKLSRDLGPRRQARDDVGTAPRRADWQMAAVRAGQGQNLFRWSIVFGDNLKVSG